MKATEAERLGKAVMLGALMVAMMLAPGRACGEGTMGAAPVRYVANLRLWVLTTEQTSYVMGLNERDELQTLYWGGKLESDHDLTAASWTSRFPPRWCLCWRFRRCSGQSASARMRC